MNPIYLDYNATTPLDPLVVREINSVLETTFGNPSSGHLYGWLAKAVVELARDRVAALLGCAAAEIIFTSGGTESNNQALIGFAFANRARGKHIISTAIEHPAVLEPLNWLQRQGFDVTLLPVDGTGRVDPQTLRQALTTQTILVSVMHANNEIGTLQPLTEIGAILRERGIRLHTDAAQSVGKVPTRVDDLGVDLLTLAGHKLYAPKGVGALYVRTGVQLDSYLHGAGHETGRRAGTENVVSLAGLGKAAQLAGERLGVEGARLRALRDHFWRLLQERVGAVALNGHPTERLPNTLNVSFAGVNGAQLLARLPEIAASTGSACHDDSGELSSVLMALGIPREQGFGAVRLSLGRGSTMAEVEQAAGLISQRVQELRGSTARAQQ